MTLEQPEVIPHNQLTFHEAAEWVMQSWQGGLEAVLETGRRLIELKAGRLHGQWGVFIAEHLPLADRTVRALMQIARHPVLANRQHAADLPSDWTALARLASLDEDQVRAAIEQGDITPALQRQDVGAILDRARGLEDHHKDSWFTPRWLFEQIGATFDLDVCAPPEPEHRTCPAHGYYTEADDGLVQPWHGLVWCNPPYSTPEAWADRMVDHDHGLLLIHMPNNAKWAVRAQWAASAARLVQSMHFERPNGDTQRPGYSLMLLAFGPAAHLLTDVDGPMVGPLWVQP